MCNHKILALILSGATILSASESINISGKITNASEQPVQGAIVRLVSSNATDTTDENGFFQLLMEGTDIFKPKSTQSFQLRAERNNLSINVLSPEMAKVDLFNSQGRFIRNLMNGLLATGLNRIPYDTDLAKSMYILRCQIGDNIACFKLSDKSFGKIVKNSANSGKNAFTRTSAAAPDFHSETDMLEITHDSYVTEMFLINPQSDSSLAISVISAPANWVVALDKLYADQNIFASGLNNGNYMVMGSTHSVNGDYDLGFVVLDRDGSIISKQVYGGLHNDLAREFAQNKDGTLRIFGFLWNTESVMKNDLMTMCLSTSGDSLGEQLFLSGDDIYGSQGLITDDSGYIITGLKHTFDSTSYLSNYKIVAKRVSSGGEIIWSKEYGPSYMNLNCDIIALKDGGYLLAGTSYDSIKRNDNLWLLKLDENGDKIKEVVLDDPENAFVDQILETNDNKLFLLGRNDVAGFQQSYLARFSSDLALEWDSVCTDVTKKINCMVQLNDGSFILACSSIPSRTSILDFQFEGIHLMNISTDGTLLKDLNITDDCGHAESISLGNDNTLIIAAEKGYTLFQQKFYVLNVNSNLGR